MKEKIHLTYVPLYEISLRLIITTDVDESAVNRGFNSGAYEALTVRYKGKLYIVITKKATPGTIAHEAIHAASEILNKVGVKSSFRNQEPLSYLAGWITDWVVKKAKA